MCKCSPAGCVWAADTLWTHQGHTREDTAELCPFWMSLTLLPAASPFSFPFCHSVFSHPFSRFASPSLCIWIISSSFSCPSFCLCFPGVKSSQIFFGSVTCLSFLCPPPPLFFPCQPQLTPPLPQQLRLFFQTKATLSLFIWPRLFLPLVLVSLGFSSTSCQHLIFLLPVVSHIPFLMQPDLCSLP